MPKRTKKQIEASRANGRKSHGAVTPEGKARIVKANLQTGIYAEEHTIGWEFPQDLDELREEYYDCHPPRSPEARAVLDQIVMCEWRLRRFAYAEAALWDQLGAERPPNTEAAACALRTADTTFQRLQSRINATQRIFHQALLELERLEARDADVVVVPTDPVTVSEPAAPPATTRSKQEDLLVLGSLRQNTSDIPAAPVKPDPGPVAPASDIISSKCEPLPPPS